jgi:hypothetical protein
MLAKFYCVVLFVLLLAISGCYKTRKSTGGAQIKDISPRQVNAADIALPKGYRIEPVTTGLTFPSAVTFDESGNVYLVETGYSYGEIFTAPKLLKIDKDGSTKTIATGTNNGPWTGITFYKGSFMLQKAANWKVKNITNFNGWKDYSFNK